MTRKKQVNSKNRAVLNRDFPRRSRSLIIGAEELRRLFPNVKPEYIDLAIKRFGDYRFGDDENEIEAFGKILIAVILEDALGTKEDSNEHH
jgi:hypothetical protein